MWDIGAEPDSDHRGSGNDREATDEMRFKELYENFVGGEGIMCKLVKSWESIVFVTYNLKSCTISKKAR